MKVAYLDLGFSKEDYSINPRGYGGGAVFARYAKEDPALDFHLFAPQEAFVNVGPTERADRCYALDAIACHAFQHGAQLEGAFWNQFDLILHGHTCFSLRRGTYRGPLCHWSGFDGKAGHPKNNYILLYNDSFLPQFGERAKYVRIGKPVADRWIASSNWFAKERFVFQCSRHDDHLTSIALAKQCLAEGFKGVFAGPIHGDYRLRDFIDDKTTFYLGEIDEQTKLDYCRRAGLYGMLHTWSEMPFNQSVIEAQGQGTPIYTYPKGPFLSVYLQHKHNGFDASLYSLTKAWAAADQDMSFASWKAAQAYSVPVMVESFKRAFVDIVDEWREEHSTG